jgi:hypothetical protein
MLQAATEFSLQASAGRFSRMIMDLLPCANAMEVSQTKRFERMYAEPPRSNDPSGSISGRGEHVVNSGHVVVQTHTEA